MKETRTPLRQAPVPRLPRREPGRRGGTALALALLLAGGLAAQAATPSRAATDWAALLRPAPGLAELGLLPEPLGYAALARAALLASGVGPAELPAREAQLSSRLDAAVAEVAASRGPEDAAGRAEELLRALHRGILRSYSLDATTLPEILDRGLFNCVSSAVLYLLGLERLGLSGGGVRTSDHAFCFVRLPGGREVDVETTNAAGYDPGTKKEFTDAFGSVTGFSYVPPGAYARRNRIGEKALVALILSNRSALLERRGDYAGALALGASLHALQGDAEGRAFLLDRVNNLVASLVQRRDFAGAEEVAAAALAALGPEPRLAELLLTATYDRILALYEGGKLAEALEAAATATAAGRGGPELSSLAEAALGRLASARLRAGDAAGARSLVEARRGLVGEAAAARILGSVADAELVAAAETVAAGGLAPAAFADRADRALAEGELPAARHRELLAYAYGSAANRLAAKRDWLGAAALAAEGAARTPGDTSLRRAAQGFRGNFVADAHNRFAQLFNARDWKGALQAVEAALGLLPGEATLLADRELARKAIAEAATH